MSNTTIMDKVMSADGTHIAFDRIGEGPAVILVASALADRSDAAKLAGLLGARFTVINYDRRGRGDSGDITPYAVEREVEDLDALIDGAGGSACVFGSSSGSVLALRAAASGLNISRLAVYEPPFRVDGAALPAGFQAQLEQLLAADRRSDAVKYFMRTDMSVPAVVLGLIRLLPGTWRKMTAMAHTLPYEYAVMGDTLSGRPLSAKPWAGVTMPTLVMSGSRSPARLRSAAATLTGVLPNAEHRTLVGHDHSAVVRSPNALATVLTEFFNDPNVP
jgi:pimeloyl-ACP methyl ester carboxylesterase